ncbi:hypothetical protein, partial [Devosia chinhatensis]|uniref:hypothetical protein n=1 Tax=Devosia chinhatensis TaxID=429727 RepID=UPI00128B6C07
MNSDSLQARLRTAIAWNAVAAQAIMPSLPISALELDQQATQQVSAHPNFDYILNGATINGQGRSAPADTYHANFSVR